MNTNPASWLSRLNHQFHPSRDPLNAKETEGLATCLELADLFETAHRSLGGKDRLMSVPVSREGWSGSLEVESGPAGPKTTVDFSPPNLPIHMEGKLGDQQLSVWVNNGPDQPHRRVSWHAEGTLGGQPLSFNESLGCTWQDYGQVYRSFKLGSQELTSSIQVESLADSRRKAMEAGDLPGAEQLRELKQQGVTEQFQEEGRFRTESGDTFLFSQAGNYSASARQSAGTAGGTAFSLERSLAADATRVSFRSGEILGQMGIG